MEEKPMSEQESLRVITEMIQKAKGSFHEDGTSAILWGSVVGVCGLLSFAQKYFDFSLGFDVWTLALVAILPQIWLSIRENRRRTVKTHQESAMDAVWIVYSISITALILYFNVMPYATRQLMDASGEALFVTQNGVTKQLNTFIPSFNSLLILIYGIPTLTTGISRRFKPMLVGGILCYCFFAVSLFTPNTWDYLLNGLAAIVNWLIPGLILRKRYYQGKGNC